MASGDVTARTPPWCPQGQRPQSRRGHQDVADLTAVTPSWCPRRTAKTLSRRERTPRMWPRACHDDLLLPPLALLLLPQLSLGEPVDFRHVLVGDLAGHLLGLPVAIDQHRVCHRLRVGVVQIRLEL